MADSVDPVDLAWVRAHLERQVGLRWQGTRGRHLDAAVRAAMQAAGAADPRGYAGLVERDPVLRATLLDAVTVGESHFLREPGQLAQVRDRVLPALVEAMAPGSPLRVWSAGCAGGEEAYSLAIVLAEAGLGARARVLATDVSPHAVARAAAAVYRPWSLRGVDEPTREAYFRQTADGWRVTDRIAAIVEPRVHNLVTDAYPGSCHLVVCRNVLLYLTDEHRALVAERLAGALAPGGWLLIGAGDPSCGLSARLEAVPTPAGVLYRRPAPVEARTRASAPVPPAPASTSAGRPEPQRGAASPAAPTLDCSETSIPDDAAGALAEIQAVNARDGAGAAERRCVAAVARHPLDARLRALHALLLAEAGEHARSGEAARAALFLEPGLVLAHLALGRALLAGGDASGAARAFRDAAARLADLPADAAVALADGEPAGRLAKLAQTYARLAAQAGEVAR